MSTIVASESTQDRDLERRIINYLTASHVPGARRLKVKASNGLVTLSGTLRSFYQKQLCCHVVRRVAGVVQLVDQLSVA
ncbi:MAG TPA: BON domain-containing protein [Pirellulales bacterium]|nr:BON domain-containing protein [Pirellulales bacterium]